MSHMDAFTRSFLLRTTAATIMLDALTACGGGGGFVRVGVVAPSNNVRLRHSRWR